MKKWVTIVGSVLVLGTACHREGSFPEVTDMPVENTEEKVVRPPGRMLAQVILDSVAYEVKPEEMLQPFIDEFDDGTVVDKAMIKKVQATPKVKPRYYVVGIGLKNGESRVMAIELFPASDNSLYVNSQSRKYITTSSDCEFCMFTFLSNEINGAECTHNGDGTVCTYKELNTNNFMW